MEHHLPVALAEAFAVAVAAIGNATSAGMCVLLAGELGRAGGVAARASTSTVSSEYPKPRVG